MYLHLEEYKYLVFMVDIPMMCAILSNYSENVLMLLASL